jgi:hypothetical protein
VCLYFVVRKDLHLSVVVWYQGGDSKRVQVRHRIIYNQSVVDAMSDAEDDDAPDPNVRMPGWCFPSSLLTGNNDRTALTTPVGGGVPLSPFAATPACLAFTVRTCSMRMLPKGPSYRLRIGARDRCRMME